MINVPTTTILQQQQQFYYYLYQKEKYTFAPQIARKLVMAGQAGTRTTFAVTEYLFALKKMLSV